MLEKVEKHHNLILFFILLIAILVRSLFICSAPNGIHEDEAGLAYDAYSIAEYGVDRYLTHNPVYLINFSGGQSVLYVYTAALFIKLFGFSLFIIRLPAVLFNMIAIFVSYLTVKKFKGPNVALLFSFFIAICPWHIMQSRWVLDCYLLSSLVAIDVFAITRSSRTWHYILSGIFLGLTLYTYALSYILLPVFIFVLLIYLLITKKITIKNILIMIIPTLILAFPLIMVQVVNIFGSETLDLGFISMPKLFSYRATEFNISNIIQNLNITKANNIFQLLFCYDHNEFNSFREFGTMYYISIPFILYGIFLSAKQCIQDIKNKKFSIESVFFIQFISMWVCLLFFADLQLYKLNALFIPCLFFLTLAIIKITEHNKILLSIILSIYLLVFCFFTYFYFTNINTKMGIAFNNDLIPLVNYINSKEEYSSKSIHIESDGIQQYIYVLLANKTSPYDFCNTKTIVHVGYNAYEVIKVDKYTFLTYDKIDPNTLYVVEKVNLLRQQKSDTLIQKLEDANFKKEEWNGFYIYSK